MKRYFPFFFAACLLTIVACGDEPKEAPTTPDPEETMANEAAAVESTTSGSGKAICLWPKVGLRSGAGMGKDLDYLATVYFGETVTPTGETEEANKSTYIKVRLSNGDEGWLKESLFALDATTQIATDDIDVYPRPDLMTYKGEKFERGNVIAVTGKTDGEWFEVFGLEKKPKGWIRDVSNLSDNELDVTVGVLYNRAMQEKDKKKRMTLLNNIATNSTFSASGLMGLIDETLAESAAPPRAELPANQAYIDATVLNVRSQPDVEQDNVVFQVKENDVVEIIERGERIPVNGMDDYWYMIRFNGQEGWIYGAHTSKKL